MSGVGWEASGLSLMAGPPASVVGKFQVMLPGPASIQVTSATENTLAALAVVTELPNRRSRAEVTLAATPASGKRRKALRRVVAVSVVFTSSVGEAPKFVEALVPERTWASASTTVMPTMASLEGAESAPPVAT